MLFDQKYSAIEQENKLLRKRNAELQQMINYMMTQAKCNCEYFGKCQDDPLKDIFCPLIILENKLKAEREGEWQ